MPFALNSFSKPVKEVAATLPFYCLNSSSYRSGYYDRLSDTWYTRAGVQRPRTTENNTFCLLDEGKLTQAHWQSIEKLLPPAATVPDRLGRFRTFVQASWARLV